LVAGHDKDVARHGTRQPEWAREPVATSEHLLTDGNLVAAPVDLSAARSKGTEKEVGVLLNLPSFRILRG
jgi:hypothetical protein